MVEFVVSGGPVFDGRVLHDACQARFRDGRLAALEPLGPAQVAPDLDLNGDILCPGYVDLQVNGGDGILLNDLPTVEGMRRIASAHRSLGCQMILPTLITDSPSQTRAAIDAAVAAVSAGVPGVAGLHLEGPHLAMARKGAHDSRFIRAMTAEDLDLLCQAAERLPVLKLTFAPESVTLDQVAQLIEAGAVLSLGHSDADYATCRTYFDAGVQCATHLFNAMSQLGSREPGLVGAALAAGAVSAGVIADGIHVSAATLGLAARAKSGPGALFLVSDAMAVAGTNATSFMLQGRHIRRQAGRLTLEDGTLAGADLDLTRAIRVMVSEVGLPLVDALRAATTIPAQIIGRDVSLTPEAAPHLSDLIRVKADLSGFARVM